MFTLANLVDFTLNQQPLPENKRALAKELMLKLTEKEILKQAEIDGLIINRIRHNVYQIL